jgi:hypothetical protein
MHTWDLIDVMKEKMHSNVVCYQINYSWPSRMERTAKVCLESFTFGPTNELFHSWNKTKAVVIPLLRGERKPRSVAETVVKTHAAKLQGYLHRMEVLLVEKQLIEEGFVQRPKSRSISDYALPSRPKFNTKLHNHDPRSDLRR